MIFPGGRWSYDELARASNRLAALLVEDYRLRSGARVLLREVCAQWLLAGSEGEAVKSSLGYKPPAEEKATSLGGVEL